MSPEQFSYWLQGFVELNGGKAPTAAQWKSIKEHLAEVFVKVTPPVSVETKTPDVHQETKKKRLDTRSIEALIKDMQRDQRRDHYPPTLIC